MTRDNRDNRSTAFQPVIKVRVLYCYVTREPARKEEQERQSRPAKSGGLSTDARPSRLSPSRGFEVIEVIDVIEGGKRKSREINNGNK